jgi:hypothetical protein
MENGKGKNHKSIDVSIVGWWFLTLLLQDGKKALTSKLQSVNNWVHNHNHGLVVKGFLQLQKPCPPLSSRVSMVCVHQCFVRREIQN